MPTADQADPTGGGQGPAEPERGLPRADFVTALALIALAGGIIAESWRMPRLEALNINPFTAPGVVPGVLGVALLLLAMALLLRAVRQGGHRRRRDRPAARPDDERAGWRRFALALGLALGYALGLLGRVPFWLATGLFIFAFVTLFEARGNGGWPRTLAHAAVLAVTASAAVTLVFQELFLVRLP